mmetsp:Transcript_13139/g.18596  ORF Transcript_13139/g.18596 Transcript_13139/m.18596 type:complete len:325 (-) Transcript_13139:265-1239(-)
MNPKMAVALKYHCAQARLPFAISWRILFLWVILGDADSVYGWTSKSSNIFRDRHHVMSSGNSKETPVSRLPSQLQSVNNERYSDTTQKIWFDNERHPFLALITEPDACDTDERIDATVQAIHAAVSTNLISLVSIRVVRPPHISHENFEDRVIKIVRLLMELTNEYNFFVVVTSDWVDAAIAAPAHGVHVKESHRSLIPEIRQRFPNPPLIGTSAHSISSAVEAWSMCSPNYFFVGTCYATQSHPDKVDLEGPTLPGKVRQAFVDEKESEQELPIILAIGGVNSTNCHEPVCIYGADGVAVIRSVLQASDPAKAVLDIFSNMNQ